MAVPVVGLTGGIASGKSTVARAFAALGVPVVDADQLAREVVAPGSEGLGEIIETFGADVLLPDGTLDRKVLGERVFANDELRRRLNAITHPRVARLAAERLGGIEPAHAPYAIYEVPLLIETGLYRAMHAVIVVAAEAALQRLRVLQRDGLSHAEAERRMAAQLPLAQKLAHADYVIDNNGELSQVTRRVADVHEQLVNKLQGDAR